MRLHRFPVVALLAAVPLALTGCSQSASSAALTPDPSAHAYLDTESGEIVLPLTEYDFYGPASTLALANHATDIAFAKCMNEKGFAYSAASVEDDTASRFGDRSYGIWNESRARLYGYGAAPSAINAAFEADRAAGGDAWEAAYEECAMQPDPEITSFTPDNAELTESLVPQIQTLAYNAASADPAWQQAREAWWQCLREEGLEPRTGSGDWSSVEANELASRMGGTSADKAEEIRIATTEARCNTATGLTQTLGDLEASYQAPLIAASQDALDELKAKNQDRLAAIHDYIARNS